jgi:transposase
MSTGDPLSKDSLKPWWHETLPDNITTWSPTSTNTTKVELDEPEFINTWFRVTKLVSSNNNTKTVTSDYVKETKPTKHYNARKEKEHTYPLRTKIVKINPTSEHKTNLRNKFHIARKIWNECVEHYQPVYEENNSINAFRDNMRTLLVKTNNCGTIERPADLLEQMQQVDQDIRRDVVDRFVTALYININKVKTGTEQRFRMNFFSRKNGAPSLYLACGKISKPTKGTGRPIWYPSTMGNNTFITKNPLPLVVEQYDAKLVWDHRRDLFYLHYLEEVPPSQIDEPKADVCSIDPGVRIFNTIYGSDGVAYLVGESTPKQPGFKYIKREPLKPGETFVKDGNQTESKAIGKIMRLVRIAARMRAGVKRVAPNNFVKTTNKRTLLKLRKLAANYERRAKNLIKEIHNKLAHFLCRRYKTIVIPNFPVRSMIIKQKPGGERRTIGPKTALAMCRWSHYTFRQHLIAKGEVEGCKVIVGKEDYTSKTCSECYSIKPNLGDNLAYACNECGAVMHRDVNGARNILFRNWMTGLFSHPVSKQRLVVKRGKKV